MNGHGDDGGPSEPSARLVVPTVEEVAQRLFGPRLGLARTYADILSTDGVERGLVGPHEAVRIWERHVLNCAVLAELLAPSESVVDIGSGAGLPGVVLALARPDLQVALVEPLLRRAEFLTELVERLDLDVRVLRGRAEDRTARGEVGGVDVVTARAVAPLGQLMAWCLPLARTGGRVLAMKGRTAAEELVRDQARIARLGGTGLRVRECGVGIVDPTALVVEAVRGGHGATRGRQQR